MTPPRFDYQIGVEEMRVVEGKFRFAAKIVWFGRRNDDGSFTRVPSPVGEAWGEDKQEASRKARESIDAWIASQASGET